MTKIISANHTQYAKEGEEGYLMACICDKGCEGAINLNDLQEQFNSKLLLHIKDKDGKIIPLSNI